MRNGGGKGGEEGGGNSSLHEVRGRCDGNDNMGRWLSCKETVSHERQ